MISQGKNAVIVENLDTGHRMPAYASARISALEDISIYTEESEVSLAEVLEKIRENEEDAEISNPKKLSSDELKAYFAEIIPDYDRDRVYVSDMKKVLTWYNDLLKHGLLDKEPEEEPADETAESEEKPAEAGKTENQDKEEKSE